jgi:SAM-dependent methyltransferase
VEGYHLRTPYPSALAAFLQGLMTPRGGNVIELGCGTGELARMMAPHSERVDAIDVSAAMLEKARSFPAKHPAVRWIPPQLRTPFSMTVCAYDHDSRIDEVRSSYRD